MQNQHQKITGYRDLSQAEIDLMNAIKAHGAAFELLRKDILAHLSAQYDATCQPAEADGSINPRSPEKQAEFDRITAAGPFQWLAVGTTQLQQGLMAVTRAVAQPTSF